MSKERDDLACAPLTGFRAVVERWVEGRGGSDFGELLGRGEVVEVEDGGDKGGGFAVREEGVQPSGGKRDVSNRPLTNKLFSGFKALTVECASH